MLYATGKLQADLNISHHAWQSEHYFWKPSLVAELAEAECWNTLRCWMKLTRIEYGWDTLITH